MFIKENQISTGNLELLAKQVVEGFITGLHKSPFHGFSVEFAEHKMYNKGDSIRNIDWKLYARTDKLFVKKFEEETNLRCKVLIDISKSMKYPKEGLDKLKFSILAAASLMHLLKKQRDAMGLTLFNQDIVFDSAVKSSLIHHRELINRLDELLNEDLGEGTQIASTLHKIAESFHRRSLIILFTDMFDGGEDLSTLLESIQHLKYHKHEVIVFHVSHAPSEVSLEFENRPYTFQDLESGEKVKLYPSEIKDEYERKLKIFHAEIKDRCSNFKIDYVNADISKGIEQILIPFLIKRQKMRG